MSSLQDISRAISMYFQLLTFDSYTIAASAIVLMLVSGLLITLYWWRVDHKHTQKQLKKSGPPGKSRATSTSSRRSSGSTQPATSASPSQ